MEEEDLIAYTNRYLENLEKTMQESVLYSTEEIKRRLRIEHDCGCLEYKIDGRVMGMAYYFHENSS